MFYQSGANETSDPRKYLELLERISSENDDPESLVDETTKYLGLSANR